MVLSFKFQSLIKSEVQLEAISLSLVEFDRSVLFFVIISVWNCEKWSSVNHQYRRKEDERQDPDRRRQREGRRCWSEFVCHVWFILSDEWVTWFELYNMTSFASYYLLTVVLQINSVCCCVADSLWWIAFESWWKIELSIQRWGLSLCRNCVLLLCNITRQLFKQYDE